MKKQIALVLAMFLATATSSYAGAKYDYLVFLDIDGVLNNRDTDVTKLYVIEPFLTKRLKPLFKLKGKTGIVLTSTWRYTEKTRDGVTQALKKAGLKTFFSCTPNFSKTQNNSRAKEIAWWLNTNTTNIRIPGVENLTEEHSPFQDELPSSLFVLEPDERFTITGFVIIDDADISEKTDNADLTREIGKHFVHVSKVPGVTEEDVNNAIQILTAPTKVSVNPVELLMNSNNPAQVLAQLSGL